MLRRAQTRQLDIVEFFRNQRTVLQSVKKARLQEEKGFGGYFNDFTGFIKEYQVNKAKRKSMTPAEKKAKEVEDANSQSGIAIQQQFESMELLKKMKWKRITWDNDADYTRFSRRIIDNDSIFSAVPAFSYMNLHVVKDGAAKVNRSTENSVNTFQQGDLTRWFLEEGESEKPAKFFPSGELRRGPFSVDWTSGEAKILDSISTHEMHTFLVTTAHRLQAVQVRMADEQERVQTDLESVRVRLGVTAIVYNKTNTAFWDDPRRKDDPDYVDPADVRLFVNSMMGEATLYRQYLYNHQIRILPSGRSYFIDSEKKEIHIPADFQRYHCLTAHQKFQSFEKVLNMFRTTWYIWFGVGLVVFGDLEVL